MPLNPEIECVLIVDLSSFFPVQDGKMLPMNDLGFFYCLSDRVKSEILFSELDIFFIEGGFYYFLDLISLNTFAEFLKIKLLICDLMSLYVENDSF